jgi:5-formyltetrahydrofolate cyclo-ligase
MNQPQTGPVATHAPRADAARSAKMALRAQARARRDGLPEANRAEASKSITAHVLALLGRLPARADRFGRKARGVGIYSTLGSEVDTAALSVALTRKTYPFALPKVLAAGEGCGSTLIFRMVDAKTPLEKSQLGIMEPVARGADEAGCHHRLAALFVPCLAFSAEGARLGYGRGYYDRLLAGFGGHIIGLAFEAQRCDALVAEPHDVPLHAIVTEKGLFVPQGSPWQLLPQA